MKVEWLNNSRNRGYMPRSTWIGHQVLMRADQRFKQRILKIVKRTSKMTIKQRESVEKAINVIQEIMEEQQEKQSNLECAYMEHLPIYETISEEVEQLEYCHDAMITMADELEVF